MSSEYDDEVIESVSVRRQRLRDAALFGADRTRQRVDEGVGKVFAGVVLAAAICAGCIGWSFIDRELAKEKQQNQQQNQPSQTLSPSPSGRSTPVRTPTSGPTGRTTATTPATR